MKITFLGTGSVIPSPKKPNQPHRSYSAIYVELKKDTLLFDIGPGALTKLHSLGINTQLQPGHLFITHYHIDHCGDYPALAMGRCFDLKTERIGQGKNLQVYGPSGLKEFNEYLFEKTPQWSFMTKGLKVFDRLTLKEKSQGLVAKARDWQVSCCPVPHYNGVAYCLKAEGKTLIYSGDMAYNQEFAQFGKRADLVIVECSTPDRKTLIGAHCCPEDVGKLAKLGKFKQTILLHLYPRCEGKEKQMIKTVKKLAPQTKVKIANDLMILEL